MYSTIFRIIAEILPTASWIEVFLLHFDFGKIIAFARERSPFSLRDYHKIGTNPLE